LESRLRKKVVNFRNSRYYSDEVAKIEGLGLSCLLGLEELLGELLPILLEVTGANRVFEV